VLSDGRPDDEARTLDAARRLVASAPGGVCLHAVQVGNEPEGAAFTQALGGVSECGSSSTASALRSGDALTGFTRTVMLGNALPPVAAAPLKIVLRGINFDFDSSEIRAEDQALLDAAIEVLQETQVRVQIGGHTDSTGPEAYNQTLSKRRAESVLDYLRQAGVDQSRLQPTGFGEADPVTSNETRDGRAQNRRVVFEVQQ
jgi:OOP family OmpA-OmpF porin